jgi:PAS domain S-box-containing protein
MMEPYGIQSEKLLQLAVEASPNAMVLVDSGGGIVLVNSQTEKLFGYLRKDLLGQKLEILLPGRFHATHPEHMRGFFAAPETRSMGSGRDLYGLHKDGSEIPVEIGLNPITTGDGIFVLASIMDITARRRMEQSLQLMAAIVESSDDAIISKDLNGVIQSWNRGAEQIFGYSAAEMIGQPMSMLFPPDRADEETQILACLRRGERLTHFETVRMRKDGERIEVSATISPIYNAAGRVIGASKVARDITERKRSQAALESVRSRQTAILNNSLDCIITIDCQGRILDFNPAAERTFGYGRDEVLHKSMVDLIVPPSLREAHQQGMKHYLATGEGPVLGKRIEITAMRADGSEFPIELAITAITGGGAPMFTACLRDLTERKQNEAALDERIRLLALTSEIGLALSRSGTLPSMLQQCTESIVRQLDGAFARIWTLSESGDTLELQASAGMYTHLDGPHGRVPVGQFKIGLIARERKPHLTNKVVGDPRVSDQEWALREGMVAFAGHPLIVDGHLVGVVAIFARHSFSEATIATLGSAADAIATGISRKHIEEALLCSELQAQAANRAKSDFLANMSHEIRTPMNGVLGLTRLMLNTDLTPLQREYLEMTNRSAESLLQIINDILDFSKIEANKLTLVHEIFSLTECAENAVSDCAVSAQVKNLELTCDLDPMIPEILVGDAGRLRQVLLNLISNAIKFTDQGEVDLTVRTVSVSDEEIWLHFSIHDTGIGIPAERQARIFEAFEQSDASISRTYGGTGLGLSISARIVSMMGGVLEVESEMGVGSTFHFRARFAASAQPLHPKSARAVPELQGLRVLVVDDNATNRRILHDQLIHWNMNPHCVATGKEAVQAMHESCFSGAPFALVLLDALMPEMDGFVVAKELREKFDSGAFRSPMIMMLSSADQQQDIARCRSIGINSCLTKPVRASMLLNTILEILENALGAVSSVASARPFTGQRSQQNNEITPLIPVASPNQGKLRILLAEDNAINQKVASATLHRRGFQVTIVNNGLEAIEAIENQTFDLVLMDVQMPKMDGLQATAAIRRRETASGGHLPIIALTAHAMQEDRERCLTAGMDDYAAKPINPSELEKTIRKWTLSPHIMETSLASESLVDQQTFDPAALLERLGGDTNLWDEILDLTEGVLASLLEELAAAISQKNASRILELAHTLKGTLLNLTANNASQAAFRLEQIVRDGNLSQAHECFALLQEQVHCVSLAIAASRSGAIQSAPKET